MAYYYYYYYNDTLERGWLSQPPRRRKGVGFYFCFDWLTSSEDTTTINKIAMGDEDG